MSHRAKALLMGLACLSVLLAPFALAAKPDLYEPALPNGKATIKLPGEASEAHAAGGGRFLVLHLKKEGLLAVVDVCEMKVAHFIQLPSGEIHFAAGLDKVFISSADKHSITRYNLANCAKETSVVEPEDGVSAMYMGASALRTLVVASAKKTLLYDPATLRPTEMRWEEWGGNDRNWPAPHMRVSGEGRTIVAWGGGWAGLEIVTIDGQKVIDHHKGGYIHDADGPARLSYDGQFIFVPGNIFTGDVTETKMEMAGYPFASLSPHYILSLSGKTHVGNKKRDDAKKSELKIFLAGEKRSIWSIKDVEDYVQSSLPPEQRIFFIPDANVIAAVGADNNSVLLRRFNIVDALDAAGIDYLFVNSTPPTTAERGKIYAYKVETMSKAGDVTYSLTSGPPNMTVSKTGVLAWQVPAAYRQDDFKVVISVKDKAGQEIFHTFSVNVEKPGGAASPPPPKPPAKPLPKPQKA